MYIYIDIYIRINLYFIGFISNKNVRSCNIIIDSTLISINIIVCIVNFILICIESISNKRH